MACSLSASIRSGTRGSAKAQQSKTTAKTKRFAADTMTAPSSLPSSPTQATETEPVSQNFEADCTGYRISENSPTGTTWSHQLSYRERWGRNRLVRLSSMPPWMYRGVVDRFMLGTSPRSVVRWIFDYPDEQRGGIWGC